MESLVSMGRPLGIGAPCRGVPEVWVEDRNDGRRAAGVRSRALSSRTGFPGNAGDLVGQVHNAAGDIVQASGNHEVVLPH